MLLVRSGRQSFMSKVVLWCLFFFFTSAWDSVCISWSVSQHLSKCNSFSKQKTNYKLQPVCCCSCIGRQIYISASDQLFDWYAIFMIFQLQKALFFFSLQNQVGQAYSCTHQFLPINFSFFLISSLLAFWIFVFSLCVVVFLSSSVMKHSGLRHPNVFIFCKLHEGIWSFPQLQIRFCPECEIDLTCLHGFNNDGNIGKISKQLSVAMFFSITKKIFSGEQCNTRIFLILLHISCLKQLASFHCNIFCSVGVMEIQFQHDGKWL